MEIKYLQTYKDYPTRGSFACEGLSEVEIKELELEFNEGNPFPKALKEWLYLAGNFCLIFDAGLADNQVELQKNGREYMTGYNASFNRPIYIIETRDCNHIIFIYLDEDKEDPYLYQVYLSDWENDNNPIPEIGKMKSLSIQIKLGVIENIGNDRWDRLKN